MTRKYERPTDVYYNAQWRSARIRFLTKHTLCVKCKEQDNQLVAATEIDHIIPHKGDYDLFWDTTNWQPLCHQCHSTKTAFEVAGDHATARPDWLPKARCKLTIVCGPPAAGKSTYVAAHKKPWDIVIDLDEIKAKLEDQSVGRAPATRNKLLANLASEGPSTHA
jgi:HNH endonuclease